MVCIVAVPKKQRKILDEFEKALLNTRNRLKETEDKIEERARCIELHGEQSADRASIVIINNRMRHPNKGLISEIEGCVERPKDAANSNEQKTPFNDSRAARRIQAQGKTRRTYPRPT
eukprot:TRINITY_DN7333_c0_g1_i7.p1 TRINITY_DN7333_c0_g1~~TRINITY_DN7333_c0_g1_i7.p1  ORF type:complete len:118 (-),score=11.38 TRINITY_DN7333_c0_g1_i7:616-969(-)